MTTKVENFNFPFLWKTMQILSPLVSVIALIVYMQVSLAVLIEDVAELKGFNRNIGNIITAHTTQLALNQRNIQINQERNSDLKVYIVDLHHKVDELKTLMVKGNKREE